MDQISERRTKKETHYEKSELRAGSASSLLIRPPLPSLFHFLRFSLSLFFLNNPKNRVRTCSEIKWRPGICNFCFSLAETTLRDASTVQRKMRRPVIRNAESGGWMEERERGRGDRADGCRAHTVGENDSSARRRNKLGVARGAPTPTIHLSFPPVPLLPSAPLPPTGNIDEKYPFALLGKSIHGRERVGWRTRGG